MYNATLNELMRKYGKVKGLKSVCSICKKYGYGYDKMMVYIPSRHRVYAYIFIRETNFYDDGAECIFTVDGNLPVGWDEDEVIKMDVRGCETMVDLYRCLVYWAGDLK